MQPESNAHGGRVRQAHRHFMWVCVGSQTSTEVNEPTCFGTLDLCGLGVTGAPRGPVSPGTPAVTFSGLSAPKKKKIFLATAIFHYLTGLYKNNIISQP